MENEHERSHKRPAIPDTRKSRAFIDAVDYALASGGMGADERQNIVADLREQIEEMLSDRARHSGKPVAIEDVESVLAELDPPESYTEAARPSEAETPVHSGSSCEGRQRHHGAGHSIAAVRDGSGQAPRRPGGAASDAFLKSLRSSGICGNDRTHPHRRCARQE